MTLTERLLKIVEFDDNACAASAIDASVLFEQYFTSVEPQPMGTPKQIFRMGYAQGVRNESARLMPIIKALIDSAQMLERTRGQWIHSVNAQECLDVLAALELEIKKGES